MASMGTGLAANRTVVADVLDCLLIGRTDVDAVSEWEEVATWEYGYRYLISPREELLADLVVDLTRLDALIRAGLNDAVARQLSDAGARLATLLTMTCIDLNRIGESRQAWRLARRLGDASGSAPTQQWVRGQEALLGLYAARPLPVSAHPRRARLGDPR